MADTAAIASEIQRLHGDYYGQPPGQVRVYEGGDILVVVIEEAFTRAEQVLIARGEAAEVQIIRRRFQLAIADQFTAIVQRATGRRVRVQVSIRQKRAHLAIETFVLGESLEDMTGFEREGARADSEQAMSDQSTREGAFKPPEH